MNKQRKIILYVVIGILVIIVLGIIYYLISQLSAKEEEMDEYVEQMTYEKEKLAKEQLENEYASIALEFEGMSLKIDNDSLLTLIDTEQQHVKALLEELRTVKASNTKRISELQAELTSVRTVLNYYVRQVDSLSVINAQLQEENRQIKDLYQDASIEVQTLSDKKEELEQKVATASQLEAQNIKVELQNARGRKTASVRRLAVIKVSYTLDKNITTEVGNKTVYMRINTPDDMVLQKNPGDVFQFENRQIEYSSRKSFEYSGQELEDMLYYTVTETLWAGDYRIDLFVDGHLIGSQYFTLKK